MKRLPSWLKELALWLWEARVPLGTIAIIIVALLAALGLRRSEDMLRITGWFLEFLGIGTVAWGIRDTRKFFGLPGPFKGGRRLAWPLPEMAQGRHDQAWS